MSIRLKLTAWYTAILSATLLVFCFGLYTFLHYNSYSSLEEELKVSAEDLKSRMKPELTIFLNDINVDIKLVNSRGSLTYYQVIDVRTGRKGQSSNLKDTGIVFPEPTEGELQTLLKKPIVKKVDIDNRKFLIYNSPILVLRGGGLQVGGVMQAAYYIDATESTFALLRFILTIAALLSIFLAASVGWFLARKALRPIDQVIAATNQIQRGADLDRRIEYYGPHDEIGRLTSTINNMLERIQGAYAELEEAYRAQRRFVSDASHELRTPLTTIRGNVDLLEKMWRQAVLAAPASGSSGAGAAADGDPQKLQVSLEAMQDIAGEAERMSRLVNDLLSLARADAGFKMTKSVLEMRPVVEEVVRRAQLLPRKVEWLHGSLAELDDRFVMGNKDYLQQLLFIFIENAFKYTDHGHVRLDAVVKDGQVGIRIEDTGIGMDKEEIPHIFERFYRADPSRGTRSGTGLGLSIAKWIIDEHGGSIEVTTRKGEGSTFVIWFPAVDPAQWSEELGEPDEA